MSDGIQSDDDINLDANEIERSHNTLVGLSNNGPTSAPNSCDICGIITDSNEFEPRFGYMTCGVHKDIPPFFRNEMKAAYKTKKLIGEILNDQGISLRPSQIHEMRNIQTLLERL